MGESMTSARSLAPTVTPNYYNYYKTNTPNMAQMTICLKIIRYQRNIQRE